MLTIRALPGAPLEVNCYLVADPEAGEALLIDAPRQVAAQMATWARELGVTIRLLVCTHGHWDHTMGAPELIEAFGMPVACHPADVPMLEHPSTAPFALPFDLTPITPDRLVQEGEILTVGGARFTVLHTPGHTPGGVCLYEPTEGVLFSGDTIFAGARGRTDLPGGDAATLVESLRRLRALPPATRVYPGHGPATTLGREHWLAQVEEMMEE